MRVGIIQHQIVLPTSAPIAEQRNAIFKKIGKIISLAAEANVNIVCLQEAWCKTIFCKILKYLTYFQFYKEKYICFTAMPFVFCTREKFPWCEFAESIENGPSTTFLKDVFKIEINTR